ncbi:MAG: hypothetical protein VB877_15470 [Pirellulaceae bacterium]
MSSYPHESFLESGSRGCLEPKMEAQKKLIKRKVSNVTGESQLAARAVAVWRRGKEQEHASEQERIVNLQTNPLEIKVGLPASGKNSIANNFYSRYRYQEMKLH